jgi:predicted flap endonuclease-1-like 5' DNA nuclease
MFYLIEFHWIWLLLALVLGLAVGWLTFARGKSARTGGWLTIVAAAFVIGLIVALLKWLPGRPGYWLDLALLMVTTYAIGCCLGAWLRRALGMAPEASLALVEAIPATMAPAAVAAVAAASITPAVAPQSAAADLPPVPSEAAPVPPAAPSAEPPTPSALTYPGVKPPVLAAARDGAPDDLKLIKGIGPKNEKILHDLGVFHFSQIAAWTPEEAVWMGHYMAFPGRIEREHWIDQAKILSSGGDTEHSVAVKSGQAPSDDPLAEADAAKLTAALPVAMAAAASGATPLAAAAPVAIADRAPTPVSAVAPAPLTAAGLKPQELATAPAASVETPPAAIKAEPPAPVAPTAPGAQPPTPSAPVYPGAKPPVLAAARDGAPDDLKLIKGIGPKNEKILHDLGVFHFSQIAAWTPEEAVWMGHYMAFPGRIEREHWIDQAKILCSGVDTEHSVAVKSGQAPSDELLTEADATKLKASLPVAMAAVEGEGKHEGVRPLGLMATGGGGDDLKRIKGIGPQNERRLHGLGIWRFSQIAAWTAPNVKWVGSYLAFHGRIDREDWVGQARVLARGEQTKFSERVAHGEVPSKGHGDPR